MSFEEAEKLSISVNEIDKLYLSAVNMDTSKAVFKLQEEQEIFINAYKKLLNDLALFLSENNFTWNKPMRCFNKVYFNVDGKIDYFLYNFKGETENERPTYLQEANFKKLLNQFIKNYQLPIRADVKFSQCSPVTYKN